MWVLWAYLAVSVVIGAMGRILDRFGWSWLRSQAERFQLRSVRGLVNLVLVVAVAAPVIGEGIAQAAPPAAVSAPQVPGAASGGASLAPQLAAVLPRQAAPAAQLREHVVREGEDLWEVAASQCGSPLLWRDIADENGIRNPDLIRPGLTLKLPAACEVPESQPYVVQRGDTLTRIAQREDGRASAWKAIVARNQGAVMLDGRRFTDPNRIEAGWTLQLPTGLDGVGALVPQARPGSTSPAPPAVAQSPGLPSSVVPGAVASPPAAATTGPVAPVSPVASASPAAPSPAASTAPGGQAAIGATAGSGLENEVPGNASAPWPPPAGKGRGWHVRLPGGDLIPLSLGACLLALGALAKARRQRGSFDDGEVAFDVGAGEGEPEFDVPGAV